MSTIDDTSGSGSNLVLRTVYIQKDVDDRLRKLAFQLGKSKNDIIRHGINLALAEIDDDFSMKKR